MKLLTILSAHLLPNVNFFVQDGIDAAKISVLRNGADHEIFGVGEPDCRDPFKLVFAGALVRDKGIDLLLQSFAELKPKYPQLTLDVYGSADLWGREKFFDESEVERNLPGVRFYGKVSQDVVANAYQTAAIGVVPSIWFDPFPLTAMEAQVTGCPVVTFNVGGLGEGVVSGQTGIVLDDINQQALTGALDQLLSAPDTLRQMSENALKVQRPKYTWDKVAKGIIDLCEASTRRISSILIQKRLGIVSTWNQQCGLATYCKYFTSGFAPGSFTILAEDVSSTSEDESFVTRCWTRGSNDFSALRKVIAEQDIGLLHLNCHYRYFPQPDFSKFIKELQGDGQKMRRQYCQQFHLAPLLESRCRY